MKQLVYATTNPGKFQEVSQFLSFYHLNIHSPREFGIKLNVVETGKTLEENASLKAESFLDKLPNDCVVIGDDTGVEIKALNGEPGIKVRRWLGYPATDQEIIDYCIQRMKDVSSSKRQAQFRTVIAVATKTKPTKIFSGTLKGHIVKEATPLKIKGFPFESLFYIDEYQMMLGELHQLSVEQRLNHQEPLKSILTHRERAIISALSYLKPINQ